MDKQQETKFQQRHSSRSKWKVLELGLNPNEKKYGCKTLLALIVSRFKDYCLSVMCIKTDGDSVMKKIVKLSPAFHQLYL